MLEKLRRFFTSAEGAPPPARSVFAASQPAPDEVSVRGHVFPIAVHCTEHYGLPIVDWDAAQKWVDSIDDPAIHAEAWSACERAWLLRMRSALGAAYRLDESEHAALVSSLEPNVSRATLDYMERTLRRIVRFLDGVAEDSAYGKDILLVFDDEQRYYEYVSHYYQEPGEYAASGGMHINAGCSHFVTVKADLALIEPVIAHEMTHGCLSHLPLPLWLNEGIAVNMEWRLTGTRAAVEHAAELRDKHTAFWGEREIQQFWSGESFGRTDDGRSLSYDLARVMVEQLAKDWKRFRPFALAANWSDAGAEAAETHLGIDLGAFAAALVGKDAVSGWSPGAPR